MIVGVFLILPASKGGELLDRINCTFVHTLSFFKRNISVDLLNNTKAIQCVFAFVYEYSNSKTETSN